MSHNWKIYNRFWPLRVQSGPIDTTFDYHICTQCGAIKATPNSECKNNIVCYRYPFDDDYDLVTDHIDINIDCNEVIMRNSLEL